MDLSTYIFVSFFRLKNFRLFKYCYSNYNFRCLKRSIKDAKQDQPVALTEKSRM
jgi:hypothetical protein